VKISALGVGGTMKNSNQSCKNDDWTSTPTFETIFISLSIIFGTNW